MEPATSQSSRMKLIEVLDRIYKDDTLTKDDLRELSYKAKYVNILLNALEEIEILADTRKIDESTQTEKE